MSVEENHLLQLLGEKLYHSIPKVIPRFYPPWRYNCNYRWMTEADFAGHNIVIAEENYEGKLVTPVLAILVPCPRRDRFNLPDLDTVLKFNNDSIAQLNWGCEGSRYPFVYKISYNSASICKHGYTGRYGGSYTERRTQLPISSTDDPTFFPLQNFRAVYQRQHDRKLIRWLMSRRAKCTEPGQENLLRKLFLQQGHVCDVVLACV
jgi:hypothetical protein